MRSRRCPVESRKHDRLGFQLRAGAGELNLVQPRLQIKPDGLANDRKLLVENGECGVSGEASGRQARQQNSNVESHTMVSPD